MRAATQSPSRLVMGCAQLGMDYGRTNETGLPALKVATRMVGAAWDAGVRWFDTARVYGQSEDRLGTLLAGLRDACIVTKLDPLSHLAHSATPTEAANAAQASLETSLEKLHRCASIRVLVHRAAQRLSYDGAVWAVLSGARARGDIDAIGVSAQSPEELLAALSDPSVQHVQFPFNPLDSRWVAPKIQQALASRPDVTVHVRSVYLQGVLLAEARDWPPVHGIDASRLAAEIRYAAEQSGRSVAGYCVSFVLSAIDVDGIVIGMENEAQVNENLSLIQLPSLSRDECASFFQRIGRVPMHLLDPSRWPQRTERGKESDR